MDFLVLVSLLVFLAIVIGGVMGLTYTGLIPQEGSTLDATALQTALAVSDIKLFTNALTVGQGVTVVDFTEAAFTGYAAQALATVPAPLNDSTYGGVSIFIPSHVFACTGAPLAPVTVYGWWLQDATGKVVAAGNFSAPFVVQAIGDTIPLQVTLNFNGGSIAAFANIL